MTGFSRRAMLLACGSVAATGAIAYSGRMAEAAQSQWEPRGSHEGAQRGLDAFEGVEDDRGNSHPQGKPHIFVDGDAYHFRMHKQDVDSMTDRQRQEVRGMRRLGHADHVSIEPGTTWRLTWQVKIPDTLLA